MKKYGLVLEDSEKIIAPAPTTEKATTNADGKGVISNEEKGRTIENEESSCDGLAWSSFLSGDPYAIPEPTMGRPETEKTLFCLVIFCFLNGAITNIVFRCDKNHRLSIFLRVDSEHVVNHALALELTVCYKCTTPIVAVFRSTGPITCFDAFFP